MEILTAEQMRDVDRRAIETLHIPSLTLMESAGEAIALALLQDYPALPDCGILILCGKGNNGGDGLVAARHLARRGVVPRVVCFAEETTLSPDAAHNLRLAHDHGLEIHEALDDEAWSAIATRSAGCALVLDAILGTGIRGGARGIAATVIRDLNATERHVVSVDLPSGLNADTGEVTGIAVRAQRTYTLCRPKRALVLPPASEHAGALRVLDIGIPDAAISDSDTLEWVDRAVAQSLFPGRRPDAHKGDFGHLLAVAGSPGKAGAAVLVARAALRSGVGLITVAAPAGLRREIAVQQAEVMTEPLAETVDGRLDEAAAASIAAHARNCGTLAIGPGLGTAPGTVAAVRAAVRGRSVPTVLDADGLNAFAGSLDLLRSPPEAPPLILTPHPGEAARLLDTTVEAVRRDRLGTARGLAGQTGAHVVLKGRHTLMSTPDGRVAVNSSGNPGMASAGSGDVLTGILGAFLARKLPIWDAIRLGVWVHGEAGDRAARIQGQDGLIASDLIENLPRVLASLNPA